MGMFDWIDCKAKLPNQSQVEVQFQTQDLGCNLGVFTITSDGKLIECGRHRDGFSGEVVFYGYEMMNEYQPGIWREYKAEFVNGVMISVEDIS